MILAMSLDKAIGNNGDLLCRLSADLKHFKELTMGHSIIMGRKTFESLPHGALPGRRNIVISRNVDFGAQGAEIVGSIDEALRLVATEDEAFIIGGAQIYGATLDIASKIYLTEIEAKFPLADTRLEQFDMNKWELASQETHQADSKNEFPFTFKKLIKRDYN